MSALAASEAQVATVSLDVVVPVYNEERDLAPSVRRLHDHLSQLPYSFRITIADNASTDATALVAHGLAREYDEVRVEHLTEKGRGRALKQAWTHSDAEVLVYMDVDLSTDLNALLPLVAPLLSGHSDIAIGTRLSPDSRVIRGPKRELISRAYNLILRSALHAGFTDAQCGFKAIRADVARSLVPQVRDNSWFFDTELLVLAEHAGLRIHEVPVDWVDDPDSRVDVVRTARDDLLGIGRLRLALLRGGLPDLGLTPRRRVTPQLALFVAVGIVSTLAYAVLFVLFKGIGVEAFWANATALVITAVANTSANRRLTFGVRGTRDLARHQIQGLVVFAVGLVVTTLALRLVPDGPTWAEMVVLTVANLVVTAGRFAAMKLWIFNGALRRVR
ncbi:MAG: bifunctional glycosyltransferase family 2/GtrA family protein [Nocardioidaceae bacterium]